MKLAYSLLLTTLVCWGGVDEMNACYEAHKEEIDKAYRLSDSWKENQQNCHAVGDTCVVYSFRERNRVLGCAWLAQREYGTGAALARMELGLEVAKNLMASNEQEPQYIEWLTKLHVNRYMLSTMMGNEQPLPLLLSMELERLLPEKPREFFGDDIGCLYIMDVKMPQIERGFGESQKALLTNYGTSLVKMVARNYLGVLTTGRNLGDAEDRQVLLEELQELQKLPHDAWTFPELELVRLLIGVRFPKEKDAMDCECRLTAEQWQSLPRTLQTAVRSCLKEAEITVPSFIVEKSEQK